MTDTPDWATLIPSAPVHPSEDPTGGLERPFTAQQLVEIGGQLVEGFIRKVVEAVVGAFIPGAGPAVDQLFDWAHDLGTAAYGAFNAIGQLISGVGGTAIGDVVAAITGVFTAAGQLGQKIIDAIVNGLTGAIATGSSIAAIPLALLGQVASIPAHVIEFITGSIAGLQAQMTAIQNNPTGVSQTDDFNVVGVTGWTAITGTLAVSARGPYIQTPARMGAYIGTPSTARKPSTDKHGISITIDGKMNGSCRAWICGDTTMSNYAAVEVYSGFDGDSVRLLTGTAPGVAVVWQKVDFVASQLQNQNTFDIWYEPAVNTFHVLRNGQSVFDWVDGGNVVTHGSSKRNVGIVTNGTNCSDDGFWGPGIRKVTFYDR